MKCKGERGDGLGAPNGHRLLSVVQRIEERGRLALALENRPLLVAGGQRLFPMSGVDIRRDGRGVRPMTVRAMACVLIRFADLVPGA